MMAKVTHIRQQEDRILLFEGDAVLASGSVCTPILPFSSASRPSVTPSSICRKSPAIICYEKNLAASGIASHFCLDLGRQRSRNGRAARQYLYLYRSDRVELIATSSAWCK